MTTILIRSQMQLVLIHSVTPPMYVCICHGVSDHEIRRAAQDGVRDMHVLTMRTGCGSGCGSCVDMAAQILAETAAAEAFPLQILQAA